MNSRIILDVVSNLAPMYFNASIHYRTVPDLWRVLAGIFELREKSAAFRKPRQMVQSMGPY